MRGLSEELHYHVSWLEDSFRSLGSRISLYHVCSFPDFPLSVVPAFHFVNFVCYSFQYIAVCRFPKLRLVVYMFHGKKKECFLDFVLYWISQFFVQCVQVSTFFVG